MLLLEAPAEAEAQCAALELLGLVNGVVTEDSDAFVFGANTVYKNIFDEQKYAEVYKADDAIREMNLNRHAMVALAMLLGGDYTDGVKGVGIVNAMEILEAFDTSLDVRTGLTEFKTWLEGIDVPHNGGQVDPSVEGHATLKVRTFHEKHPTARARWVLPDGFPNDAVVQAYLHPVVEQSREPFAWGVPDVARLQRFCARTIGWSPDETLKLLQPVMDKIAGNGGLRQTRIESFMKYEDRIQFAKVQSKRLRTVLGLPSTRVTGHHTRDSRDRVQDD